MSVCELGPCCLGGGGNSISLRPKEFRPLEQGHVLMFSRSFLRSQTVTFNRHSNYPTMPSGSVLRLCSTSLAHVTVKTADSGLCPLLELKKMDTEIVSVHPFLVRHQWRCLCSIWHQNKLNLQIVNLREKLSQDTSGSGMGETAVCLANITKQAWGLNFSSPPPPLTWSVSLCFAKCSTCVVL